MRKTFLIFNNQPILQRFSAIKKIVCHIFLGTVTAFEAVLRYLTLQAFFGSKIKKLLLVLVNFFFFFV